MLPVNANQHAKCTYFLCITSDPAAANAKVEELAEAISPSSSDVTSKDKHRQYRWMSLSQMKHAQKTSQLAGFEPIVIFKQMLEGKLASPVPTTCCSGYGNLILRV